jgi:Ca2+-binding RTX toxin-like protein
MTTLSATATSLLNLHYTILGSQPTLAQLNTYAGEYNKARAAGATADAAMDAIASHILESDAAVNTLMPNLSSPSALATAVLANVGVTNAAIVEFISKALDGSLFGFAFPLNQAVRVISDYVANYKTGMAADATWDADLVAAQKAVVARPVPQAVGQSFTLTTGIDLLSGGADADNFYGSSIDNNGTGTSINPGDNLAGGAGTDMLSLKLSGSTANPTIPLQTTGIEKISVGNYNSFAGADTIALAASSDVTELIVSGSGDTAFTGVRALAKVSLSSSTGATSVAYATSAVAGTADTQALSVSGAGTASSPVTFTVGGIETLAITGDGTASGISLAASNDHKTITVAGAAGLTILASGETTITTVDASASTGGVSVQDLGASKLTMTGGAGNDTLRIDGSTIDIDDSINAGEGTDKLIFTAATNVTSATNGAKLVGFETVEGFRSETFAEDSAVPTVIAQDTSLLSAQPATVGVSSFSLAQSTVAGGGSNDDETLAYGVNFTNLAATTNMSLSGMKVTDASLAATGATSGGLIVNFTATADLKTDTTADAITATLGTSSSAATGTATQTGGVIDSDTAFNLTLSLDDYETVNLVNQGGSQTIASLLSGDLKTLNVNASKAVTISSVTASALRTIDASASTADVKFTAAGIALGGASTLTGGAGNDSLEGSSAADSIVGGAGNDTIDGAGGNDTIFGGDGGDTITVASSSTATVVDGGAGADTITGGSGNESISGGADNDVYVISFANWTSADTINGGDGTDSIAIASDGPIALTTANASKFTNVTSIERYTFASLTGNDDTVSVDDTAIGAAGGSLGLVSSSNSSTTFDMSGVLSNASKTTVSFTSAVTATQTIKVGNGVDVATLTGANDEVIVGTNAYLSAADTISGGSGTLDTVIFTQLVGANVTAGLGNVTNVERIAISADDSSASPTADYLLTLTDAWLANNYNTTDGVFAVTRNDVDRAGNTTKVDGSAVTSSYNLALDGAAGNDTLAGGAGRDTIFAGAGVDSLSGGAGNDSFVLAAGSTDGEDTIVDLDLGAASSTSPTTVDMLNLSYLDIGSTLAVRLASSSTAGSENVIVANTTAYATSDDMATAIAANAAITATKAAVIWQDTLGTVHLTVTTDAANNGTETNIVKFSGLSIVDVASKLTAADLSYSGFTLTGSSQNDLLTGGFAADVLNGGAGADNITGGADADVMTGGAGADNFVFNGTPSSDTGITIALADRIADFLSGTDTISGMGVAGSATGEYTEAAAVADFATALAAANVVFAATNAQSYYLTSITGGVGLLFINDDNNAVAEAVIQLTGITAANFAATDILA